MNKKLVAIVVLVVGMLAPSGVALAQTATTTTTTTAPPTTTTTLPPLPAEETPSGTFSAPTRAVAGAPIVVRSITPCPGTDPSRYQFVGVGIKAQIAPDASFIETTYGDLAPDGSWEVTIAAPSDMKDGVTKSYSIHAQCLEDEYQYAAPVRDPNRTPTTLAPVGSYFRYFLSILYVTGLGEQAAATPDVGSEDSTSSSTSSSTSTSTTSTTFHLSTSGLRTSDDIPGPGDVPVRHAVDKTAELQRAREVRAELEAQGVDTSGMTDVQLLASPAAARLPGHESDDGAIPWWVFVLGTILVVGAVIGSGAKRSAS
jgi:hypothetical protein